MAAPRVPKKFTLGRNLARHARDGLLVTPRVTKWMRENNGELVISPEVAERIVELLSVPPRDRSGSFSPSARGNCLRAQALGFLGAPQEQLAPDIMNLFMDGRFRHLRWQAVGLQAGFLTDVEVSVRMPAYLAHGSIDGTNDEEGWGFELKGTRMNMALIDSAYQLVMEALDLGQEPKTTKGSYHVKMMWKHIHQVHGYMHQLEETGRGEYNKFSLLYEHKESQAWTEFVVNKHPWMDEKVKQELEDLNRTVRVRKLPQILEECRPEPTVSCPYHRICHDPYKHLPEQWANYMGTPVHLVTVSDKKTIKLRKPHG